MSVAVVLAGLAGCAGSQARARLAAAYVLACDERAVIVTERDDAWVAQGCDQYAICEEVDRCRIAAPDSCVGRADVDFQLCMKGAANMAAWKGSSGVAGAIARGAAAGAEGRRSECRETREKAATACAPAPETPPPANP